MNEYRQQWQQYRRRWVYFVAIFALFVPVVMGLTTLTSMLFHTEAPFPYIAGFWAALWIFSLLRISAWRCQRCRECFVGSWWIGGLNSGAVRRCVHCGLPKPERLLSVFPPRD
jgi:hypothetical protein